MTTSLVEETFLTKKSQMKAENVIVDTEQKAPEPPISVELPRVSKNAESQRTLGGGNLQPGQEGCVLSKGWSRVDCFRGPKRKQLVRQATRRSASERI